ncbi:MAG: hypothetical protein CMH91_01960 [Oceanicaulis sp.]|uniref:hypothetical protein n=1 Tax=unclassified Oceanicaulis TaxID=2632123 RepID=UPI000C40DC3B|nr:MULTISPECIES: hypothetical protein [unclassified Oceanicaulis]MAB68429.1 hypothetical protein [Oceanicaulis sp.]MBC37809.1 hypothetical protein [Oceanicaulis sp.]MBG34291.1 hypothetical protein [Oceanicaulis sp.]HBU62555.1 hypothetical protein [Oceanicaulis sp.]|tara:strand:- start:194 stop:1036 length:843 start_codon:yes stop_codon:yes gene_type:complete
MKQQFKRVTAMGLGLVLTGGLVSACNPASDSETAASAQHAAADSHAAPETDQAAPPPGVTGEGEGGIVVEDASEDPVVYGSALAVAEAHVIAARDAHAVGEIDAAGEMFAHPASEVLFDMEDTFRELGVEPFEDLFLDASAAVFNDASHEEIVERTDAIIARLREAMTSAPDNGASEARIAAGIAADQIDRAVDMYRIAQDNPAYGPYLDGYGFYHAGKTAFDEHEAMIESELPEAAARIREALALLADAYPSAEPQDSYPVNRAELNTASTQATLAVLR